MTRHETLRCIFVHPHNLALLQPVWSTVFDNYFTDRLQGFLVGIDPIKLNQLPLVFLCRAASLDATLLPDGLFDVCLCNCSQASSVAWPLFLTRGATMESNRIEQAKVHEQLDRSCGTSPAGNGCILSRCRNTSIYATQHCRGHIDHIVYYTLARENTHTHTEAFYLFIY
jgi:hypothetical protein